MIPKSDTRIFRVVSEDGFLITDDYNITYKYPFYAEFEAERVSLTDIRFPHIDKRFSVVEGDKVYAVETQAIDDMYWNIMIRGERGVHVYQTMQLVNYLFTIPDKTRIIVSRRSIVKGKPVYGLRTGLSTEGYIGYDAYHHAFSNPSFMLVPLTGVLFGRVVNTDGLLVRKSKEIYSPVTGVLNMNARVYIQGKDFSDLPSNQNVHRYQLINNQGWINVYANENYTLNVQLFGHVPFGMEDSAYDMAIVPCEHGSIRCDKDEGENNLGEEDVQEMCISCMIKEKNALFLHGGDDGEYGHRACCMQCAHKIIGLAMTCPICRLPIERVIQIF